MNLTVRPMGHPDLPAVLAIEREVQPSPWSIAVFRSELLRDGRCYLVAEVDGTVVGFAGMFRVLDEGHVTTVGVAPGWQARGIGTRLMIALHRHALAQGVQAMSLEVRSGNTRAQSLYRRLGYAPVGVRPRYYSDNAEDALIMWLHELGADEHRNRLEQVEAAL